jgi:hypothetical protein
VDNNPLTRIDPTGHFPWWCGLTPEGIFFSACRPPGVSLWTALELTAIGVAAAVSIVKTGGENTQVGEEELSAAEYASLAEEATQIGETDEVYLGRFTGANNPSSYQNIARANKGTYFNLPTDIYNEVKSQYGEDAAWKINEAFINQQISQGKNFILTNDPDTATGTFAREVKLLANNGYSFVWDGQYWQAVK